MSFKNQTFWKETCFWQIGIDILDVMELFEPDRQPIWDI